MGLGREVADAYIEVHGDLSKFRKDLEGAQGKMEELAKKNAKSFTDAWDAQAANDFKRKWADTVQAMYSGEKLDFNRLVKSFDATDLDAAEEKIKKFLENMSRRQKLTGENYKATKKALLGTIEAMRLEEKQAAAILEVEKELGEMREKQNRALEERAAIMDEAIKDNKAWARSFEGLRKNSAIAQIEDDFKKLAKVMDTADVSKFMRGMSGFDEVRDRVKAVTDQMLIQRRITQENADQLHRNVEAFITQQEELGRIEAANAAAERRAKAAALDAARQLREEQDRYRASLDGMVQAAHFKRLERDFTQLAVAMENNDWSAIARGSSSMEAMRDRTMEVAREMRNAGRIGDQEFARIASRVREVEANASLFNIHLRQGRTEVRRMEIDFRALGQRVIALGEHFRGTFSHLRGLAGLNVLGDMVRSGLEFAQNIDRAALRMSQMTLSAGTFTSLIGTAVAGLITVGSDALKAANVGILAPAFLTAFGIQVGVAVAAFKDMKTVLKDLGPQFSALQDSISASFWAQAEQPIRRLTDSLMPTLQVQLKNTATAMGGLFAAFADGFRKNATPQRVEAMFKKMNAAINIAKGAMEPITSALVTLGEVGSDYFTRFGQWIVDLSTRFNNFITKAAKDGRLKRWIDEGIEATKDLGRVAGGIVEIFGAINEAATNAGIGGLKEFREAIEAAADFMQGDRFQKTMTTLFEGMKLAVDQIKTGIRDLGPAIESVALEIKQALENIGTAVGDIITIIAGVLSNPLVQDGIVNFTQGIEDAIKALAPAVKPFSDSLGKMMTNLGDIVVSIAEIVTAFTVTLMPVIDQIGDEFMKLADPLKDSIINAIAVAKPVLESLNKNVIAPLVSAIRTNLLPAIDSFAQALGPFLSKVAEDFGPVLTTLVKDVFPPMLKFAEGLLGPLGFLFDLFTPALRDIVKGIGEAFDGLATSLEDFNTWADPAYKSMDKIKDKMKELDDFKISKDSSPVADLVTKYTVSAIAADPIIASFAIFFGRLSKGWTESLSNFLEGLNFTNPENWKLALVSFAANLPSWLFQGFSIDEFVIAVGLWLHENIYLPLKDGWLAFLIKLATIFVNGGEGEGAPTTGPTAAKVMPQMINPTAEKTFLDTFILEIGTKIQGWGTTLTTALGIAFPGPKAAWDNFWNGTKPVVTNNMNANSGTVTQKTGAMGNSITSFVLANAPKWASFFAGTSTQTNTSMTMNAATVATKVAAMGISIAGFLTSSQQRWSTGFAQLAMTAALKFREMNTNASTNLTSMGITLALKLASMRSGTNTGMAGVALQMSLAWIRMRTDTATRVGTIAGVAATLPGRIERALGNLRGTLEALGSGAMQGFQIGMESRMPWVTSAAVAVVTGAIAAAKRALDSHSPSRVFRSMGVDSGDGYILGLEDSESPVQKAAALLADSAVTAFARTKMYLAGADAALGLADGLASKKSLLQGALGELTPTAGLSISGTGGVGTPTPVGNTTIVNVAEGAIPISTPAENPRLVASMVIDEFASTVSKF